MRTISTPQTTQAFADQLVEMGEESSYEVETRDAAHAGFLVNAGEALLVELTDLDTEETRSFLVHVQEVR